MIGKELPLKVCYFSNRARCSGRMKLYLGMFVGLVIGIEWNNVRGIVKVEDRM